MMPTRWPHYSFLLIAAILGLALPMILSAIWGWMRSASGDAKSARPSGGTEATVGFGEAEPIALRFHLAALLFLGFLALALLVSPALFAIRTEYRAEAALTVGAVLVPFLIALFYCVRRGDLSWRKR